MGGELGGPGGEAPRFRPQRPRGSPGGLPHGIVHGVQGGSGGRIPPVYKCTVPQRGSGGLPPV